MLVINYQYLVHNKSIINTAGVNVDHYFYLNGVQVLGAKLKAEGTVFFITDEAGLNLFYNGIITLQQLFNESSSSFVTILINDEPRYSVRNNIELKEGEKLMQEFTDTKA